MQIVFYFLALVLLLLKAQNAVGEVFSSLAHMEGLVAAEHELVRNLENYIEAEELRLQRMKEFLGEYENLYDEASSNVAQYVANPINAYLLVKRLTADWKEVEGVMTQNTGNAFVQNITQHRKVLALPSDEDLNGAALALLRLQDTYRLDTHDMAEGELQGKKYSRQLTAGDCWELGRQSYNSGDHYHTVLWMAEALRKHDEEIKKTVPRKLILEYLQYSTFREGNIREALQLTHEILRSVPYDKRALEFKEFYEKRLRELSVEPHNETNSVVPSLKEKPFSTANLKLKKPVDDLGDREQYESLCRGEQLMDPKVAGLLRCRYVTNKQPFFFIQPIKMEEASLKPRIVIYHEVMRDDEIETFKEMAEPRLERAGVQNFGTGQSWASKSRVSKTAWLRAYEHDHVWKVTRRVGDITGLDMNTSEELHIVNYGMGGQYEPHIDHARKGEVKAFNNFVWGNRIATWLFYMSDVEAGGATVFPKLNVALWPRKGSAAFWYNLYPSGEGNEMTRHAACPVLTGSKWIATKWLHEYGQEFRRPCGLTEDYEE